VHPVPNGYPEVDVMERSPFIVRGNHFAEEVFPTRVLYFGSTLIRDPPEPPSAKIFEVREYLRWFYSRDNTQMVVSLIIVINGLVHIVWTSRITDNCCVNNEQAYVTFE